MKMLWIDELRHRRKNFHKRPGFDDIQDNGGHCRVEMLLANWMSRIGGGECAGSIITLIGTHHGSHL